MKIKTQSIEITPHSSQIKQCTVSSIVEFVGLAGILCGAITLFGGDTSLGITSILGSVLIFAFGYVINLLYILTNQTYIIPETELECVNDKPLWINGKVETETK